MARVDALTAPLPNVGWMPPLCRPPAAWVAEQLAELPVESALCLCTGWGAEPRALQRQGWSVATADDLESSAWGNRALVASDVTPVGERRLSEWLKLRKEPEVVKRFMGWANRYFTPEETIWLGIWHRSILSGGAPEGERAVGIRAVYGAIRYWLSWNRLELGFKPLPPSAVLRHFVEEANRMVTEHPKASHGVAKLAYDAALTKFPSDLLYCYVPPLEGIRNLDLTAELCEQWTQGDPEAPVPTGSLEGGFGDQESQLAWLGRLVGASEAFPLVALAYQGNVGVRLEGLVAGWRPVLGHRELLVPTPTPSGERHVRLGLLVAGQGKPVTRGSSE